MQKKHVIIASSLVVVLTSLSVVAAGNEPEVIAPQPQTVMGAQVQTEVHDDVDARSSTPQAEQSSNETPATVNATEEQTSAEPQVTPQTSQEINEALNNLDLGGWEDDLLSDDELGIP